MPFADFRDYQVGRTFRSAGRTVTEADIATFAGLTGDFYFLHMDEERARRTPFGGRIAHGLLTLSQAVGLATLTGAYGDAVLALLGVDRMRAVKPVHPQDTIYAEVTVAAARVASSGDRGVVTLDYAVVNQRQEQVMTFAVTLLVRRSPGDGSANERAHESVDAPADGPMTIQASAQARTEGLADVWTEARAAADGG